MQKNAPLRFNSANFKFEKKMYFSCVFILSFYFLGYGQQTYNNLMFSKSEIYGSLDRAEIVKLKNYDFQENFAVLLRSDKASNYFFVDISKLSSPFAFKYFIFLTVRSGNRIQTGHGLSDNRAWFITDNKNLETETLKQILSFKQNALDKNNSLSEKEKEDWIELNNY